MTSRGGKRKGAGRPKGSGKAARASAPAATSGSAPEAAQTIYEDAEAYLGAVVRGEIAPDPLRIAAAKAILPFQKRKQRAPLAATRTAKRQAVADESAAASDLNARFKNRVVELATARKKGT